MSKIFTRTYRARYTDINPDGHLAPSDYARYIIDTAYEWGENLGLGNEASTELGIYWVIRETEIQFFRPLHFMDEFDYTIWMLDWKRVRGTRAFFVKHKGETIAQGVQQIACIDSRTQRPVSPPEDLINNFRLDAPHQLDAPHRLDAPKQMPSQRFPKIPVSPENSITLQQIVSWQDLDLQEMVNNAVYIAYVEEAVTQLFAKFGWSPVELKTYGLARIVRRLHIQYHLPAIWGDTLNLTVFSLRQDPTGGSLYVGMTRASDGESIASCILDWGLIDRGSGDLHRLPESLVSALKNIEVDQS